MRYSSLNHLPRSSSLQRVEQNGRVGKSAGTSNCFWHSGHTIRMSACLYHSVVGLDRARPMGRCDVQSCGPQLGRVSATVNDADIPKRSHVAQTKKLHWMRWLAAVARRGRWRRRICARARDMFPGCRYCNNFRYFSSHPERRGVRAKPSRPRQFSPCLVVEKLYEGPPVQPLPGRVTELPAMGEPDSDPMVPVRWILGERVLARVATAASAGKKRMR